MAKNTKRLYKAGDKVRISGDICNRDYNVRISSNGVVVSDQVNVRCKVLTRIDEIDGDHNVTMLVSDKMLTLDSGASRKHGAKPTDDKTVFVVLNIWNDRHGENGFSIDVCSTIKAAREQVDDDIRMYLTERDAIVVNEKTGADMVDHNAINDIDGESLERNRSLDRVIKSAIKSGSITFNVDSEGTNAEWHIIEKLVH